MRCVPSLPPLRTQCLASWVFSTVGAIESKLLIIKNETATRLRLDLSEQQVLDCASVAANYISNGCRGGLLNDPFIYATRYGDGIPPGAKVLCA